MLTLYSAFVCDDWSIRETIEIEIEFDSSSRSHHKRIAMQRNQTIDTFILNNAAR